MKLQTDQSRRDFIGKVLGGAVAGSLFLVVPAAASSSANKQPVKPGSVPFLENADHAFVVDITQCIGCGNCVRADKRENSVPDGNYRTWVERYIIDVANNVFVDSPEGALNGFEPRTDLPNPVKDAFFVPKLCNMCADTPCTQVCPVGATFTSPDGFVLVDKTHCVGCGYCVTACPYSARFINPVTRVADKCTWCYHRVAKGEKPACVVACPTGSRKFGNLSNPDNEVTRMLKGAELLYTLKPDMGTNCRLYYKALRQEVI